MRRLPIYKRLNRNTILLVIAAVIATVLLVGVPGCAGIRWSLQAVEGHFDLLARREPIDQLINDPATLPALRSKLELVLRVRDYASSELQLPDNDSYRSYADLQRSAVVWNVIATPSYSLQAQTWCYPLAGCLAYRGWYRRSAAVAEAQRLNAEALDVLVSPATAYSTLGWFDDPVLNTMLVYSDDYLEPILASLIFHELAHQQLFVPGATGFNEAFAETVADEGVRRWLLQANSLSNNSSHSASLAARWQAWQQAQDIVNNLLAGARIRLENAYQNVTDVEQALREKQKVFIDLRRWYLQKLTASEGDPELHRALLAWQTWFAQPLNNAHLALHATYQQGVVVFEKLLACVGHDLPAFYQAVSVIGEWPQDQRDAWLQDTKADPAKVCAGI